MQFAIADHSESVESGRGVGVSDGGLAQVHTDPAELVRNVRGRVRQRDDITGQRDQLACALPFVDGRATGPPPYPR